MRLADWKRTALSYLDEPYRSRAIAPGSDHYWSWLFAVGDARPPLLGVYALIAEWRAAQDPAIDTGVAHLKLGWWREEIARLAAGSPAHPVTRYLAAQPRAANAPFESLAAAVDAASAQVSGVPLESAAELEHHATALHGLPLRVAAVLSGAERGVHWEACLAALSSGLYVTRTIGHYRSQACAGRLPFPIDELLEHGIDNGDLTAREPPAHLVAYLAILRQTAAGCFATAAALLSPAERPSSRHLMVLAALGRKRLSHHARGATTSVGARLRMQDLYTSWAAARRAARGR